MSAQTRSSLGFRLGEKVWGDISWTILYIAIL